MRQVRAILVKEMRQHWDMFLLLLAIQTGLALLVVRGIENSESTVSVFEAVPTFLILFMPISILLLCRRFFVSEYQEKTRDFLDALPVSRGKMIGLKFLLASVLLGLIYLSLVGIVAMAAKDNQAVSGLFLKILCARGLGYIFCGLAFCFMVSFTGRFLSTSYFLAMFSFAAVSFLTDIDVNEVGPFALVNSRTMAYERVNMPWEPFWQSVGFGAVCLTFGMVLALYGGGRVIRALSGKMTLKEKSFAGIGFLLFIVVMNTIDLRKQKDPFDFVSDSVVKSESAQVEVLFLEPSEKEKAEELRAWLEEKILALEEQILQRKATPVRIVLSRKLDGRTFDAASMPAKDGVLWRCNYVLDDFDRTRFAGQVMHSVINRATLNMGVHDPQHWFLDGFSHWWVEKEQAERSLEAAWIVEEFGLSEEEILEWSILSDRYGSVPGESVGYSLVRRMEEKFGQEAVVNLARGLYSRTPYYDVRERLVDWWNPMSERFEDSTGESFQSFVQDWLEQQKSVESAARADIPEFRATFEFEGDTLVYTLNFQKAPPPGTRWSLSHISLKPYDAMIDEKDLKRVEHSWKDSETSHTERLEDTYSSGQRVLLLIEVELPQLRYPLQLPSRRLVVP